MKLLGTINPEGITEEEAQGFALRHAVRAVVFDAEGCVAVLHVLKRGYHKIPGGGIESSEEVIAALQRECREEIGCEIEVGSEIGEIVEYRREHQLKQISYGYRATLIGQKGIPVFTDKEKQDGFKAEWYTLEEVIEIFKQEDPEAYEGKFMSKRDGLFLMSCSRFPSN